MQHRHFAIAALAPFMVHAAPAHADDHESTQYFENKVFDDKPTQLYPDSKYSAETDDTERVQKALYAASREDNGGVVILNAARGGGESKYRIGNVSVPSNIRLEVDPAVTIVMNADTETRPGQPRRKPKSASDSNRNMFMVGRTPTWGEDGKRMARATIERIENVEIRSTVPGERFKVDIKSEYPIEYWFRANTWSRPEKVVPDREDGQNEVFAAPFNFGNARNFRLADVEVEDNYTVLPVVLLYPDTDFKPGSMRYVDKRPRNQRDEPIYDKRGNELKHNDVIDADGNKVLPGEDVWRNDTWGRTPEKGTVENITVTGSHTGYGLLQVFGGEDIYMRDLHGVGGITVRLEPGAGSDNLNRSGPLHSRIRNIEIENISNRNGFAALWFNPHGKRNENIKAKDIRAYDSGTAILIEKSTVCDDCLDLERGYFRNVELSGEVLLAQTTDEPLAEVGYAATYVMHPDHKAKVVDRNGRGSDNMSTMEPDGRVSPIDLANPLSGKRWYMIWPTAPILAFNQLSADNIGRIDTDGDGKPDVETDREDFFAIDFSNVTIVREGDLAWDRDILYRGDKANFNNNRPALSTINQ